MKKGLKINVPSIELTKMDAKTAGIALAVAVVVVSIDNIAHKICAKKKEK